MEKSIVEDLMNENEQNFIVSRKTPIHPIITREIPKDQLGGY